MYSIGQLSRRTGVKVPTIRYYEQSGLLAAPERSVGNQRRYTEEGMQQLAFVRHARDLGFAIDDIRELIKLSDHPDQGCSEAHEIAGRHLGAVRERIKNLRRLESELKRLSAHDDGQIADCNVIRSLADHALCETQHL